LLLFLLLIFFPLFLDFPGITFPELKNVIIGEKLNEDYSMYTQLTDNTAPLAAWLYEITDSVFGRSMTARHILAFLLLFFQGAYLGIMFITRKAFNENTYIPSLLFCLLFSVSFDTLSFSAELVGSTFLLLAINNLFKEIEFRVQRDETIFNLGLFISLASLFSFTFFIYLFCSMIILFFYSRTSVRKFLLLAFGFLLPHCLVLSIAYLNDSLPYLWNYYYLSNFFLTRLSFVSIQSLIILNIVPLTYFVISVVMLQRESRFSKYQSQLLQIMFLWMGFSLVYLLICRDLRPQSLIVFFPGITFLFTHFFLFIRRKKFAEMNLWILIIGILFTSYLSRYHKLKSVNFDKLVVSPETRDLAHRRVLVLENDLTYFLQNKLATPYLDWQLSEKVFRHPEFYENLTEVYHAFVSDPPDVIIDRENLMQAFFNRMPTVKKQYSKSGDGYIKTSN
jgi:hypothetical protein